MYRFYFNRAGNLNQLNELIRIFMADDEFESINLNYDDALSLKLTNNSYLFNYADYADNDDLERNLYYLLREITGCGSEWGTLTGVRPLKPFLKQYLDLNCDIYNCRKEFKAKYLVSDSKLDILTDIAEYQISQDVYPEPEKVSIYAGIPFCPSRCSYCSFISDVMPDEDIIKEYLNLLIKEIYHVASNLGKTEVENVYIGGGTPTTLGPGQLGILLDALTDAFGLSVDDMKNGRLEFTVEAGRPDTITCEKLDVLMDKSVNRISVNPQSLNDETLARIGRHHSAEDTINAIKLAKSYASFIINSDVIAGLPGEAPSDFEKTVSELVDLGVDNITVHTLSNKRGSVLNEADPNYFRRYGEELNLMLDISRNLLSGSGYHPYYIYRQKHQIGAMENIGWCLDDKHSMYNIRTMEDKQTIIGLGAGAIGKIYYPSEDRIERVANISNYKIYMERFEDILNRKADYFGGLNGY